MFRNFFNIIYIPSCYNQLVRAIQRWKLRAQQPIFKKCISYLYFTSYISYIEMSRYICICFVLTVKGMLILCIWTEGVIPPWRKWSMLWAVCCQTQFYQMDITSFGFYYKITSFVSEENTPRQDWSVYCFFGKTIDGTTMYQSFDVLELNWIFPKKFLHWKCHFKDDVCTRTRC